MMFRKITLLLLLALLALQTSAQTEVEDNEQNNLQEEDNSSETNLNYEWIEIQRLLKRIDSCKHNNPLHCYMNGCIFDCASEPNIRAGNDFIACTENCLYITKTLFEHEVLT